MKNLSEVFNEKITEVKTGEDKNIIISGAFIRAEK